MLNGKRGAWTKRREGLPASRIETMIAALDRAQWGESLIAAQLGRSRMYVASVLDKPARHFGDPKTWPSVEPRAVAS